MLVVALPIKVVLLVVSPLRTLMQEDIDEKSNELLHKLVMCSSGYCT